MSTVFEALKCPKRSGFGKILLKEKKLRLFENICFPGYKQQLNFALELGIMHSSEGALPPRPPSKLLYLILRFILSLIQQLLKTHTAQMCPMNFMFLCQIVVSVIFSLLQNLLFSGLYVVVFLISAHDIFSEMDNLAEGTVERSYVLTEVCI